MTITVQQATYERLQSHAQPFVDTPEDVINRVLDAFEDKPPRQADDDDRVDIVVDPRRVPDLTHTKVRSARIGSDLIHKPNWNLLLDRTVLAAMRDAGGFEELERVCPANLFNGRKIDDGYHHLHEIDVSVQGRSANEAGRTLIETAERIGLAVDITFAWRQKDEAAHPGEVGRITIPSTGRVEEPANGPTGG